MLTRDAGPQLRELLAGSDDPGIWHELLPLYAGIQIELSESVEELLALGTPDDRLANLHAAFEDLVQRWESAPRIAALAPVIDDHAERLGDSVPSSLIHEEFNDNNIHIGDKGPVIIDWAESAVGHPFAGLVVTMRGLADRWGFEPGGPELRRLRDVYLEPWTRFAPMPELVETFALAFPLGMVSRALAWDRILAPLEQADRAEFDHTVPAWLDVFAATIEGTATLGT
jgi:aminoglycoside phosphotransferase (APT) family kinase protein